MEKRDNLELVNVAFENNGQKAVLTFLDKERAEVRTVNFNRQVYRDNKYVADDAKAEKVDTWCHDIFGCEFTELPSCVGKKYTVYEYDDFNSLFEVQIITKFTKDQVGQIYQTAIDEVVLDDYFIKIHYTIDGKTYESKQTFSNNNARIIQIALVDKLVYGTPVLTTLMDHIDDHILWQYVLKAGSTFQGVCDSNGDLQNKVNRVFAATESCDYTRLYKLRADGGKVNFPDAPDRMFVWNEDVRDIPNDQFRKIIDVEHYYSMVNEKLKGWPQDVYG